jgi:hypothetical protein
MGFGHIKCQHKILFWRIHMLNYSIPLSELNSDENITIKYLWEIEHLTPYEISKLMNFEPSEIKGRIDFLKKIKDLTTQCSGVAQKVVNRPLQVIAYLHYAEEHKKKETPSEEAYYGEKSYPDIPKDYDPPAVKQNHPCLVQSALEKAEHFYSMVQKKTPKKKRRCLGHNCGDIFVSDSYGTRFCPKCRTKNQNASKLSEDMAFNC